MEKTIIYEKVGGVAKIWLNKPEKKNLFDGEMLKLFSEAFQRAYDDAEVRVVVLQGKGDDFCMGFDHSDSSIILAAEGEIVPFDLRRKDSQKDLDYWTKLFDFKKPIILGIQGELTGPGVWITTFADVVVAADNVNMNNLEFAIGFNYSDPMPNFFWKLPLNIAMEFALTGYPIDAETGHKYGLFNHITTPDRVDEVCMKLASRMCRMNPYTLDIHHEMGSYAHELMGMRHIFMISKEAVSAAITITSNPRSDAYWNNAKVNGKESQPALLAKLMQELRDADDWTL